MSVAGFGILSISIFIASNFPFHHVYFNQFVSLHSGEYIRKNYEMDFWAVSYNKSLEYILEKDKRSEIKIFSDYNLAGANVLMLVEDQKKHFAFVDSLHKADYFVSNYRGHPQDFPERSLREYHSFIVQGNKINTIFKVIK